MKHAAPARDPGRFARSLRPTLADLLGLFLAGAVLLIGGQRLFGDSDTALHVATGYWILEHRAVPQTDPFSATHAGGEWFAFEWLADVIFALVHRAAGWPGLLTLSVLLISLAHVLLYRFLVRGGRGAVVSFFAVLAAAVTGSAHWLARPHLFTLLLLVLWAIVLEEVVRGLRRPAWLAALPFLAVAWANLHGGFLLGLALPPCYLAGTLIRRERGRAGALAVTSAAVVAAVLINPWGWRLPAHLLRFSAKPRPELAAIEEWAPASLTDRAGLTLFAFLALCAAAWVAGLAVRRLTRARADASAELPFHPGTLVAFVLAMLMALRAIRHVTVVAVFGATVIADGLSALLGRAMRARSRVEWEALRNYESSHGGAWLGVALVALVAVTGAGRVPGGYDAARFPVALVQSLKESGVAPMGPVFAPAHWGGYLVLEWPLARVYADGRWDMYGDAFTRRYLSIYDAAPGWKERLEEDAVGWALLPPDCALARAMRVDPAWSVWGTDRAAVAFRRRATAASESR